jgi:hypothetical protein
MYCIVENTNGKLPRYMVVLHDASVAASGYKVVVTGLSSMQHAESMKKNLNLV